MNDTDLKNIRTIYIHEDRRSSENEINLIDVALMFVRRWKILVGVTLLFILMGTVTAVLKPVAHTYRTSLQVGSQFINNTKIPFESTQTVLAKIEYSLIPQALDEYRQSKPGIAKTPKITARSPKNTEVIVLEANTTSDDAQAASELLLNTVGKITQDHDRLFESIRKNLTDLRDNVKMELGKFDRRADSGFKDKKILVDRIDELETRIANIKRTEVISPPIKSLQPAGINRSLIVLFSAMVGIFIAVLSAITVEFIEKVKERSREISTASATTD